jgi:hypothetical protein
VLLEALGEVGLLGVGLVLVGVAGAIGGDEGVVDRLPVALAALVDRGSEDLCLEGAASELEGAGMRGAERLYLDGSSLGALGRCTADGGGESADQKDEEQQRRR